jgi:hypothetical protein
MDALRKVYHHAVQIPLDNVERLWQELEAFETNLHRITAKRIMADLSPAHMQARTVLRQLVNHVGAIYPPNTPEIFLPSLPRFDASERALVGKWKAYRKWEESPWLTPSSRKGSAISDSRTGKNTVQDTPDDLGGYGSEDDVPLSPTKGRNVNDSVKSSARRTGDRDERGRYLLLHSFS